MSANMDNAFPIRKHPRCKSYDYSRKGAYFITICTDRKRKLLSDVVGRGLAPAEVELSDLGKIFQRQLLDMEKRFSILTVGEYVIMPNHVHVILFFDEAAGASPRPTVMDVVCALKSLTVRECRKNGFKGSLFQTSFHDHIIRDNDDYVKHKNYILENPRLWHLDEMYCEE